ncbi:conserved Plasmodium protein, unknown function [Plasmodium ovale curtisi]|uniref:Uncharacterized protein n=1 Tax=Plasmodium ovale curtisi TaxID=864141 RepID=A0A1A8VKQ3_PLAOA|nr:conserved Plasmodium protein, unknown function [Plasmodium ovale curtisi]SBS82502.1 conserved Plasmodium protein, unknown function [Plasmodium ovale curtisi]
MQMRSFRFERIEDIWVYNKKASKIYYLNIRRNVHYVPILRKECSEHDMKRCVVFNQLDKETEVSSLPSFEEIIKEMSKDKNEKGQFEDKASGNNSIKDNLKKTKKFCNYLTNKLGRLNKKLREIKKLETIFYANPNILTETQQIKLSKKKQVKNEIVLINRYRKKYKSYKRNLMNNVDDLSPFFYSKKKIKEKRKFCTTQEFRKILQSANPKEAIQKIKNIDVKKIPKNVSNYLVFNKVGTKEEIKILFGLKAVKINGNIIDDENYILNLNEDEVKVFDQVIKIHEDQCMLGTPRYCKEQDRDPIEASSFSPTPKCHTYVVRKRFTKDQKRVLNQRKKENMEDVKKEVNDFEKFFNIKR